MGTNGRYRPRNRTFGGGGNFSRSSAALKYYSYGSQAARVEEARDDVSLKYYGKLVKIENRTVLRGSIAKIFCALIICSCAIIMLFARSLAYNYQLDNEALMKTLETERDETVSMEVQNIEKVDVAYVEEVATTRLNMTRPQSFQIVYIEVPKSEYTVNHEASTVAEKEKAAFATYREVVSSLKEAGELFLKKTNDNTSEQRP